MQLNHIPGNISFANHNATYSFLSTGDIYRFSNDCVQLNGYTGSQKEGSANNIWLRIHTDENIESYPLLGIRSASLLYLGDHSLEWRGCAGQVSYRVIFYPCASSWFWDVQLEGSDKLVDLVYGQDIGLAEKNSILENELYAAQYLGHTILTDENGYHVCSRQNMAQNNANPYLQQGMLNGRAERYSTDALQFFGLSYKYDDFPASLRGDLDNKNMQFENSYTALQTEKTALKGSGRFTFYAHYIEDYPERVTAAADTKPLRRLLNSLSGEERNELPPRRIRKEFGSPYRCPAWSEQEVFGQYPERILPEYRNPEKTSELLSFFTPDFAHVVLPAKELLTERPHGNIITTLADTEKVNNRLITSTNYMYGLFNGQTVIGNTSKHKLLSTPRGLMNLLKNSGQRILVRIGGVYRMLGLPSIYETGLNYSRWFYQIDADVLTVTSFAATEETKIILDIESRNGISYDFVLTHQLVMGTHEFDQPVEIMETGEGLRFSSLTNQDSPCPNLHYDMYLPGTDFTWSDDRIFFEDDLAQNGTLLTVSVRRKARFSVILSGSLDDTDAAMGTPLSFQKAKKSCLTYYNQFLCGFSLEIFSPSADGKLCEEVQKLNIMSRWYAQNALVHFAVPHGLEQPGGAAWGTRDVCQGPMELFFATQKWSLARNVILHIFSHQFSFSGEWPQWFMFDGYRDCQDDCHGDVVFWPLKCVGEYILRSGDSSILDEVIPYQDAPAETLSAHIKKAVASVETRFLEGTYLISYAGGDWDDTLQPADESLKDHMVSSWTQALAAQVLLLLSKALRSQTGNTTDNTAGLAENCGQLADNMKADFLAYSLVDGVIAGFICRGDDGTFFPMLHPEDLQTGIRLRLLPLTRSIIAGIAGETLARRNLELVEKHLHFPDGVRLMDRPASYDGGVSHLFRRAEQAANVGREISLQYVHAHIRYIEALCHMDRAEQAWKALFEILPVRLRDHVPNAAFRQSNLYFSSSDGAFCDRFEYARNFNRLKDGSVQVKGGWRIYSSGPGIYLHQLICGVLGIRADKESLLLHPVLPAGLDGLRFHYQCFGIPLTFWYHIRPGHCGRLRVMSGGIRLPYLPDHETYRLHAIRIERDALPKDGGDIQIYVE